MALQNRLTNSFYKMVLQNRFINLFHISILSNRFTNLFYKMVLRNNLTNLFCKTILQNRLALFHFTRLKSGKVKVKGQRRSKSGKVKPWCGVLCLALCALPELLRGRRAGKRAGSCQLESWRASCINMQAVKWIFIQLEAARKLCVK